MNLGSLGGLKPVGTSYGERGISIGGTLPFEWRHKFAKSATVDLGIPVPFDPASYLVGPWFCANLWTPGHGFSSLSSFCVEHKLPFNYTWWFEGQLNVNCHRDGSSRHYKLNKQGEVVADPIKLNDLTDQLDRVVVRFNACRQDSNRAKIKRIKEELAGLLTVPPLPAFVLGEAI